MKKSTAKLLTLLMALTMSTSLMATGYLVSEAGREGANGFYFEAGQYNNKLQYKLDGEEYYLRYESSNSRWEIWGGGLTLYFSDDNQETPPLSDWEVDYGGYPTPYV